MSFKDLIGILGLTITDEAPDGTLTVKKTDGSTVKVNPSKPPVPPVDH